MMRTLQAVKHRLQNTWENLEEGWSHLWRNARQAMTRFTPLNRKQQDNHSTLQQLTGSGWGMLASDVYEDNKNLYVRIEVPGLETKDIHLSLEDNYLVIEGNKHYEHQEDNNNFHLMECAFGHFARSIYLREAVDETKISAKCKNGVLTVILPKQPNTNRKIITVNK